MPLDKYSSFSFRLYQIPIIFNQDIMYTDIMRCPHRFIITTSKVFHVVDRRTDFNMDSMQKDIFESKYRVSL